MGTKSVSTRRDKIRRFTATSLASLPPGKHKDPAQESLYFWVRPNAEGSVTRIWLHKIKRGTKDTTRTLGHFPAMPLASARTAVQEERELLDKGIDPSAAKPRKREPVAPEVGKPSTAANTPHSVETLASEFMRRYVSKRKRPEYVQAILDKDVLTEWKGRDVRTIKPLEVTKLLDKIVERGSPVMANRTAAVLDKMFRFAIQRSLVESSPVLLLERPGGPEESRRRCLTDDELSALLHCIDQVMIRAPSMPSVMRIALFTACRRQEIALAEWSHLDLSSDDPLWTIPIENSKTDVEYLIPLVPTAVEQFRLLKKMARKSKFVLPNDAGTGPVDPKLLTRSVARHLASFKKWNIEAFTLHDTRRTVRTGLAKLKIPPHIAERVLNHAQSGIIATYDVHAYLDEKRDALTKWATHVQNLPFVNNIQNVAE